MNDRSCDRCRVRLDYRSLVRFGLLLGLCAGVMAVPFLLLLTLGRLDLGWPAILLGAPLTGMGCGVLLAVLGYPLYVRICARSGGPVYTGRFHPEDGDPG